MKNINDHLLDNMVGQLEENKIKVEKVLFAITTTIIIVKKTIKENRPPTKEENDVLHEMLDIMKQNNA